MRRIYNYLNPLSYLGVRKYSIRFPLLFSLLVVFLSEYYVYEIRKNPMAVGSYIIFVNIATIIYFSFRNAIKGGLIATIVAISYYFYIIYSRNYQGDQLNAGITATLIYGVLFTIIALSIGYLKETIDRLIEKEADERRRLQTIIDQLPVGLLVTDLKGNITQANKQIKNILGRDINRKAVAGKDTITNATHNDKPVSPNQWPISYTLATGKPVSKKEFVIYNEKGKNVFLNVSSLLIKNNAGKPVAAASIFSDVSQQKELERRKDDFINLASHELKTPITSIKLYTDSLYETLKKKIDEKSLKSLKNIKFQTGKLQELVFDLLDFSRIQTGKLKFEKEKMDLNSLIKDTAEELQKTSHIHKIILNFKRSRISVLADKFRVYQVITNLLTNAIKYSPEGGNISVSVQKTDGKAIVSVKDEGIGIDEEQQGKIFERLYQVSDPREKTFPGLGMGLYISKEIVKRHKGRIWVKSQKGKGSTFYFSLPVAK